MLLEWKRIGTNVCQSYGRLPFVFCEGVTHLGEFIHTTNWPHTDQDLERSLQSFAAAARAMIDCFIKHSDLSDDPSTGDLVYVPRRFYKDQIYSQAAYEDRLEKFNQWENAREQYLIEATCCLNWLAESVRARLDPSFFLMNGKFRYETDLTYDLSTRILSPEYSGDQKDTYPNNLKIRLQEIEDAY